MIDDAMIKRLVNQCGLDTAPLVPNPDPWLVRFVKAAYAAGYEDGKDATQEEDVRQRNAVFEKIDSGHIPYCPQPQ